MRWLRQLIARRRLAAMMRPDPAYRDRRLAQFDSARRERYWRNVG